MASYNRNEWSSNVLNYSNFSYQNKGYKHSSTNAEVASMVDMSIQSIIPWEALTNNSNNIGSNYNYSSYSNNNFMGHFPTTAMNQSNQHGQSGWGQNSLKLNSYAQQNSWHAMHTDRNWGNFRNYSSENLQSQTSVTVTEQFNRDSSFSRNKSFYSVKGHLGNKNGNKPLKRLGNNAHNSKLGLKYTNSVKKRTKYKNVQYPKAVKEENTENIPTEYLKCYICNRSKFNSAHEFCDHIHGRRHAKVAQIYYAKYMATLKLLHVDAALASQRIIDKQVGENIQMETCFMCQCPILLNSMKEHLKSTEHNLVYCYTNVLCCGQFYNINKWEKLEDHKLSLSHLKKMGEREKFIMEEKEMFLENIKALGLEDKPLQEQEKAVYDKNLQILLDIRAKDELYTASTLPSYDSQTAVGKSLVMLKAHNHQCGICLENVRPKHIETHCRSSNHYQNLSIFLNDSSEEKPGRNNKKKGDNITEKKIMKEVVSSTEENSNAHKKSEKFKDNEDEKSIQGHDRMKENEEENIGEEDEEMLDIHEADNEILNENNEDDTDLLSNESLSENDPFWDGFCHDIEEEVDRENEECINETVEEKKLIK